MSVRSLLKSVHTCIATDEGKLIAYVWLLLGSDHVYSGLQAAIIGHRKRQDHFPSESANFERRA